MAPAGPLAPATALRGTTVSPVRRPGRWILVTVSVLTLVLACGTDTGPPSVTSEGPTSSASTTVPAPGDTTPPPVRRALTAGQSAWVAVSVARLWLSPSAPWVVDEPALESPVRFRAWLRAMTLSQRRALDVRSETEALLGDRVVVLRLRPHWAKVAVPSQPTPKDTRGYPGWIPRRQLTAIRPVRTPELATVTSRTAWLRTDDAAADRVTRISFGTRLPVLGRVPGYVRVSAPRGAIRRLAAPKVTVHPRGEPALAPSRASLVGTTRSFVGVAYLWGGLSGFGVDCSGLTWLNHRVHGIRIPRDALPQSSGGLRVSTRAPGDLLFYAADGRVHHVGMYVGDGDMIHAPGTGQAVRIQAFSTQPLRSEYVGARRYLP